LTCFIAAGDAPPPDADLVFFAVPEGAIFAVRERILDSTEAVVGVENDVCPE
jgi:hypothetical protein